MLKFNQSVCTSMILSFHMLSIGGPNLSLNSNFLIFLNYYLRLLKNGKETDYLRCYVLDVLPLALRYMHVLYSTDYIPLFLYAC